MNRPLLAGLLMAALAGPASAAITLTVEESGSDLVLTGSGSANITDLSFLLNANTAGIVAFIGAITGPASTTADIYRGITTPAATLPFGGIAFSPASSTGDTFGIRITSSNVDLMLPTGYLSGAPLSGTSTFVGHSFSSMGITAGTSYVWNWGSGLNADSLTLNFGAVNAVPEPSAWALMVAGLAVVLSAARRKQAKRTAV